jgi:short-subunit dehydrogenase involved in D-alanine esterification of teichoic acids
VRSVLVTGASTGIGRASALRLDGAGWRVFAGVRREEDAESLREAASPRLTPVHLDVTASEAIAAAAELSGAEPGGLAGLVNNAGVAVPSPLETIPIEDFRRQIEVNLTGQVAVTQALLGQIRAARGRVVFISSIGGRSPQRDALYGRVIEAYGETVRKTAERGIAPEKVAKAVEHALSSSRPRTRYLVGIHAKVQAWVRPLIPTRAWDRIVGRAMGL